METPVGVIGHVHLQGKLNGLIEDHKNRVAEFAILLIRINKFRQLNITHGYRIGDGVLVEFYNRLNTLAQNHDEVVRVGSADFMLIINDLQNEGHATLAAIRLLEELEEEFEIADRKLKINVEIGVAIFPYHGQDSGTLLINSEIALTAALRKSPPYIIYSQAYEQNDATSWDIDSELRAAIDKDQFELYFQPQVNLKTGQPFGAEALLRWKHPDRGLVRPDYFIPIAEQSNVIHGITDWTIRAALWLTKDWPVGPVPLKVSVNMSPRVFDGGGLIESIQNSAAVFNANLNNLTLEVTESALMENVSTGTNILEELKSLGVNISIDHFGTGYSSMAYFKNIPANELKIDRSFVSGMVENPKDMHIVRSMIDMSQGFGLKVVAEGVENRETFDLLKTFGCDIAQGEYVSRPMPQDKFIEWLEQYYEVC